MLSTELGVVTSWDGDSVVETFPSALHNSLVTGVSGKIKLICFGQNPAFPIVDARDVVNLVIDDELLGIEAG